MRLECIKEARDHKEDDLTHRLRAKLEKQIRQELEVSIRKEIEED